MSAGFEIGAQLRTDSGKGTSRRLRHAGFVPAIIYGADKAPQMITLPHDKILHALEQESFFSHILTLKLDDGQSEKVVLKDVQRHAYKPKIEHVDFFRVKATEKLTMNVPLHFIGEEEAAGVKEGGVISKLMNDIEIKCLPANLPEYLEVDITDLALDSSLHISDIKLPSGVELSHELDEAHDHPIVSIHVPKVEAAEESVSEEAAEDAEAAEGEAAEDGDKPEEAAAEGDADKKPE